MPACPFMFLLQQITHEQQNYAFQTTTEHFPDYIRAPMNINITEKHNLVGYNNGHIGMVIQ